MKYFNELYNTIENGFVASFERSKHPDIKQYIFVGHSLGGAMASVALFDLVKQGKLSTDTTNKSPVLITYGQPRTGNFMFANEVRKMAPVIYRHVNDNDLVPGVPDCVKKAGKCVNEYELTNIDTNENTYTVKDTSLRSSPGTYLDLFISMVIIMATKNIILIVLVSLRT